MDDVKAILPEFTETLHRIHQKCYLLFSTEMADLDCPSNRAKLQTLPDVVLYQMKTIFVRAIHMEAHLSPKLDELYDVMEELRTLTRNLASEQSSEMTSEVLVETEIKEEIASEEEGSVVDEGVTSILGFESDEETNIVGLGECQDETVREATTSGSKGCPRKEVMQDDEGDMDVDIKLTGPDVSTPVHSGPEDNEEPNSNEPSTNESHGDFSAWFHLADIENPNECYLSPSMNDEDGRDQSRRIFSERRACSKCGKTFLARHAFSAHERMCGTDYKYICLYCPERFTEKDKFAYMKHKHQHPQYFPYRCSLCPKETETVGAMRHHLQDCHRKQVISQASDGAATTKVRYVCKECEKEFKSAVALRVHMRTHPYLCNVLCSACNGRFYDEQAMQVHFKESHSESLDFKCIVCSYACRTVGQLRNHCKKLHVPSIPAECPECGKHFLAQHLLQKHRKTHEFTAGHVCTACGATFQSREGMRKHMIKHSADPRPYVCDICGKGFGQWSTLHSHMRSHTNQRPYKCQICSKAFTQRSSLATHRKRCFVVT